MRKKLLLAAGILLVAAIAAALVLYINRSRPELPVRLIPAREYPAANIEFFLQNDQRWADDPLGGSDYRMAGSGCLVCCIASSLRAQGMDTDPGELNRLFGENGVYNEHGEIVWSQIRKVFPDVRVDVPSQIDADRLEDALEEGRYPIVKVKYKGSGYQHWVVLIGSNGGEFLCMDPLNAEKEPLPLSEHGGTIYRYRIVSVAE